jgi:hypothetical protein
MEVRAEEEGEVQPFIEEEGVPHGFAETLEPPCFLEEHSGRGARVPVLDGHLGPKCERRAQPAFELSARDAPVRDEDQLGKALPASPDHTSPSMGLEADP